jgi:hypothetical protein
VLPAGALVVLLAALAPRLLLLLTAGLSRAIAHRVALALLATLTALTTLATALLLVLTRVLRIVLSHLSLSWF